MRTDIHRSTDARSEREPTEAQSSAKLRGVRVLFSCSDRNMTPYSEYIRLAQLLEKEGANVTFLLGPGVHPEILGKLRRTGCDFQTWGQSADGEGSTRDGGAEQSSAPRRRIRGVLRSLLPRPLKGFLREVATFFTLPLRLLRLKKKIFETVGLIDPDCLMVYSDNNDGAVALAMRWMRERDRPIIQVQVSVADKKFLTNSFRRHFSCSLCHPLNRLVAWHYPGMAERFDGRGYVFWPWSKALWYAVFDLLPPRPWVSGASFADRYLMIGESHRRFYREQGGRPDNAHVVGQISLDGLYEAYKEREQRRRELSRKYFRDDPSPEIRWIILCLPQFFEHGIMSRSEADEAIEEICQATSGLRNARTLVSLHPKMRLEDYEGLETRYPELKILRDERLSDVLPVGHLMISAFKSTLVWALLCRVVPVFLDCYDLGFDIREFEGCVIVRDKSELQAVFRRTLEQAPRIRDREIREGLPPFDGRAGRRIIQHLSDLLASR